MTNQPANILPWWRRSPRLALFLLLLLACLLLVGQYFLAAKWFTPTHSPSPPGRALAFLLVAMILVTATAAAVLFIGVLLPAPKRQALLTRRMVYLRTLMLAGLAILAALVWLEENWRAERDWESFRREVEGRGETLSPAGFLPPSIPDEQNLALAPIVTGAYATHLDATGKWVNRWNTNIVNRLRMLVRRKGEFDVPDLRDDWRMGAFIDLKIWQDYYRSSPESGTNEFPVAALEQAPAADVLLALSRYDAALEELWAETKRRPRCRFPLDYGNELPMDILLPHLSTIKSSLEVMKLRTCAQLELGENQAALAGVLLMLRWTDSVRCEPVLISQLVRAACFNMAVQPIWEGVVQHRWTDSQLVEIERELGKLDFLADWQLAMRGERCMWIASVDYIRRTRNFNRLSAGRESQGDEWPHVLLFTVLPDAFYRRNELKIAELMEEHTFPMADMEDRTISGIFCRISEQNLAKALASLSPYNYYARKVLLSTAFSIRRFAAAQAACDLARVGCALERHRLAQGGYPEKLDALVPQFMDKLPHDVIDGNPLNYRREDEGRYVLYSVGWNELDDGGTVVMKSGTTPGLDPDAGDWVWQFPSK